MSPAERTEEVARLRAEAVRFGRLVDVARRAGDPERARQMLAQARQKALDALALETADSGAPDEAPSV